MILQYVWLYQGSMLGDKGAASTESMYVVRFGAEVDFLFE